MELVILSTYHLALSRVLLFLSLALILLALNSRGHISKQHSTLPTLSEFDKAVQIISRIHSKSASLYGLKYRSMICTIVRNDPHLLEFLVRNFITGFSHIVIYDNNRILANHDANITNLLAPFIAAGLVTHVPWHQNTTDLLPDPIKNGNSAECLDKYGRYADWVAILDTDEYFYYEENNKAVHTLNNLLMKLEQERRCGVEIPWSMMYGEAKVLKSNKTLFEAYPRRCIVHPLTKILARFSETSFQIPHHLHCLTSNYSKTILSPTNNSKSALIHYYSKSMEEFLIKADQSVPPYIRVPIKSYDLGSQCRLVTFNYSKDYETMFFHAYGQLETMNSLKLIDLWPSPNLNIKTMTDYALYIYLKYRCAKRHEFDNEKYLSTNPEAKSQVQSGAIVDGLYHFLANFLKGSSGCWKTNNYSFCE